MNLPRKTRKGLISWQRHQIFLPRFQMTLILLLTGFAGFLTSFLLLYGGLNSMWIRYPLAILVAYAAFLILLRLWLAYQRSQMDSDPGIDFPIGGGSDGAYSPNADLYGGGGDFGGGGAGGSWGEPVSSSSSSFNDGGDYLLESVPSVDLDAEGCGLVILAVVALLGGLIAVFYIVYIAPVLLAEILVDAVLLRGLYSRMRFIERKNWLRTAVRKTLFPAILCVVFFGIAGGCFQMLAPEAKSIGEVWNGVMKN